MSTPQETPELDSAQADRLAQLKARRGATAKTSTTPNVATVPSAKRKKRHAARKSRYAALAMSLASTGGLVATFAALDGPTGSIVSAQGGVVSSPSTAPNVVPVGASTAATPTATTPTTVAPATDVTTVVNGDVFTNKWGPVQVQATFDPAGNLVSVDAVQVPSVDNKSVRINNRAVPTLNSEALTVQSATVDTVSGATYTSNDYERSLQSAIDAARAEGLTQLA